MALTFNPPNFQIPPEEGSLEKLNKTFELLSAYAQQQEQYKQQKNVEKQTALANYLKLLETDPELANTPIGQQLQGEIGGGLGGYQPPGTSTAPVTGLPASGATSVGGSPILSAWQAAPPQMVTGRGKMGKEANDQAKMGLEMQKLAKDLGPTIPNTLEEGLMEQVRNGKLTIEQAIKLKNSGTGAGVNKPPSGFRFTANGDLEAIPGGPGAIKVGAIEDKKAALVNSAVSQADRIIMKVDQSLEKVSGWTTGWGAKLLSNIPGTPARNLRADLTTVKANLGFAELQAMRQASPTGGALGQIAVQELEALQSTIASLEQEQDDDQLKARLVEVRTHYENWKKAVQKSAAPSQTMNDFNEDEEAEYQAYKATH